MKVTHWTKGKIPPLLQQIAQPPHDLYIRGDLKSLLDRRRVSIVGSRKPTSYGRYVTETIVTELVGQGIVIVSGLAFGIDSIAHQACLDAGGQTIAVLPSYVERIYPANHQRLAEKILDQGGALVSEYPPGSDTQRHHFIERNRLVSALGDGVLVVEAAENSGTLHTASFAADQGRTLMAVPGNITSSLSITTNRMIAGGATPITSARDICNILNWDYGELHREIIAANPAQAAILHLLMRGVHDAGQLLVESQLDPSTFNQTLTLLEISGKIRPLGAGQWRLS